MGGATKLILIAGEVHGAPFCVDEMSSKGFHLIHAHQKIKLTQCQAHLHLPGKEAGLIKIKHFLIHIFHELKLFLEFLCTEKPSVTPLNYRRGTQKVTLQFFPFHNALLNTNNMPLASKSYNPTETFLAGTGWLHLNHQCLHHHSQVCPCCQGKGITVFLEGEKVS